MRTTAVRGPSLAARLLPLVVAILAASADLLAIRLTPEAIAGWQRYVAAVETRRTRELGDGHRFLSLDFDDDTGAGRARALAGQVVVEAMTARAADGREIAVPSALVHHWRGAIFLPGADLEDLLERLATELPPRGPDVLRAAILARDRDRLHIYLRLQRTRFVTVVYDTEHDVRVGRIDRRRGWSESVATRIVEVADPDGPGEHPLPEGDDRGFLWRLQAWWRYEAVAGGVLAECESVTLSRALPFGLRTIAGPFVERTARESMELALAEVKRRG